MAYLLDTNACIQILNSPSSPVTQKTLLIPSREIYICTVVYSEPLKDLFSGSRLFVYIPKTGYVGVGLVKDTAVRVKNFTVLVNGQQVPILDERLVAPKMDEYVDDPDKSEYLVRVEWIKAVPKSQAYRWEKGLFANPNIVCKMKNSFTIERLSQHFGLND